jgi:adenylylsulfate kinase
MILQFCGLSGSGKTTLSNAISIKLKELGYRVEIIDGDEYRKVLCSDLGFSKEDRNTNIRRLAFVASKLSAHKIISIICAINPYEHIRSEIATTYPNVKTIYIACELETLIERDTKGLYKRAFLPDEHPDKLGNLSGVNDPFEEPEKPDLILYTSKETIEQSVNRLTEFVLNETAK